MKQRKFPSGKNEFNYLLLNFKIANVPAANDNVDALLFGVVSLELPTQSLKEIYIKKNE